MNLRQRIEVVILLVLLLLTFASYHEGSTVWLQYLTVLSIFAFVYVFDLAFTNDSNFMFDPDAENWRRKTVSEMLRYGEFLIIYISLSRSLLL